MPVLGFFAQRTYGCWLPRFWVQPPPSQCPQAQYSPAGWVGASSDKAPPGMGLSPISKLAYLTIFSMVAPADSSKV